MLRAELLMKLSSRTALQCDGNINKKPSAQLPYELNYGENSQI